ncbi:MAG: hypothetical protein JEZ14_23225 [Marinilabiliaceae bacterium]|nr:hypothetical protein [Marinilabiliaceae bacterium]
MKKYLILQHPGHNRVYYNLSGQLALSELEIATRRLDADCSDSKIDELEKVRYLSFTTEEDITDHDLEILSRLSFVFAIFRLEQREDQTCLIPISKVDYEYVDNKVSSLMKYAGKTNELFTKMMINVGLLSSDFDYNHKIQLLDPVAGRGTTLFEGVVYGFDVTGIEIEPKSVHETTVFFKKYMEAERFKHTSGQRQVSGQKKSEAIYMQEFEYARTKEEFKSDQLRKKLGVVTGNSQEAANYFKKNSFHLIIGDLPYGIAHGNKGAAKSSSITRNPSELLSLCLPQWHQVLKKGGVVVVAWNSFVVSRQKLSEIFTDNGFEVFTEAPYDGFEHLVDRSIKRDIVVARKK